MEKVQATAAPTNSKFEIADRVLAIGKPGIVTGKTAEGDYYVRLDSGVAAAYAAHTLRHEPIVAKKEEPRTEVPPNPDFLYQVGDTVYDNEGVEGEVIEIDDEDYVTPYLVRNADDEQWFAEDELHSCDPTESWTEGEDYEAASESFFDEAKRIVEGRRNDYGGPERNNGTIAKLWSAWLSVRLGIDFDLTAADVCHLMILVKEARIANFPTHRDSHVDIAGYLMCAEICQQEA